MNVTLPNGVVISDVPDDITQTELAKIAVSNNLATREDFGDLLADDTTLLGSVGEFGKRALGGIGTGTASVVTGLGQLIPGVDDEAMIAANTSAREAVAEALGYDPAYDEAYLPRLGEVVGEVLPTLIPYFGQAGRAATLAASAGRSAAAGSMMAGQALTEGGYDRQAFEQETGEELSTGERLLSKGRDVLLGQLERIGIPTRILKGLPKGYFASKEGFELGKRLESALMTAGLEGAQEVSQSIIRDVTDLAIYNPDQEIGESALEDFTLGAGAGAFFDLVLGAAEGRRRRADIKPLTEEEKEQEQRVRDEFEAGVLRGDARVTQGIAEPGPMPVAQEQDPFATDIDATLSPDDISDTILKRSPSLPVGQTFQLENTPDGYAVTLDGQQYGPKIQDANQAAQVALNLTNASQGRKNIGEVEYLIESSPNEYNETQREQLVVFGRSLQDPTANRYTSSEVDLAVDGETRPTANMSVDELIANNIPRTQWTASQRINAKRQRAGVPVTNRFTLDEIRSVNKGSVGQLGAVLSGRAEAQTVVPVKQGGNYVLRKPDGNVVSRRTYPDFGSATAAARQYNEQELLGKTIPSLDVLSLKGEATNQVANALARKNIAVDVNSKEMRGLIKRLIGKTPKATKPIDNLSPEETQLLLREISQLPQFSEPTSLPDLAAPVPNQELVRRTRRAIEIGQPVPSRAEADFVVGEPVSQAAQRRAEAQARQTAEPIERAGTGVVPEGQGLVPYDPENTGLAQVLRDLVKAFGLSDTINTKLVDRIGTARVNADGDIVIVPSKNGEVAAGSYQHVAKLIQIGLDNIRVKVAEGMSYDEAVADVMNHEIVHALRALDLFTPAEWNLLEKLSRKYKKPSTNQTYTQWAQGRYSDQSPVVRQEEAIAEMIRDALTSGVNMEGGTQRPGGKVRQLLNRLVSFFKKMISSADKAGTPTFDSIIEEIRSGQMGQRSREVRTQFRQERLAGAVPERLIDEEFFGRQRVVGDTSDRRQTVQGVKDQIPNGQQLQDAAGLTDDVMQSRIDRAQEQGFDVSTVHYHGSEGKKDGSGKTKFRGRVGMGAIAGHFTRDPRFAEQFTGSLAIGARSTIYPVFLRKGEGLNKRGGLFAIKEAKQDGAFDIVAEIIEAPFDPNSEYGRIIIEHNKKLLLNKRKSFMRNARLRQIAYSYDSGELPLEFAAIAAAKVYHETTARANLRIANNSPKLVDFENLEAIAPYIKAAGFRGYMDIEAITRGQKYTGIAMFYPEDIKGVYAQFDPASVPEGADYADDIMYSRKAGRPNIDLRPEVARAYKALQDGQITRVEYQDIVAETVRPYESVPVPATYDEMYNALTRDKREKINVPIEEGSDVGLRLDIPAYTQHGVWVPTIHGRGGKASHRATAAITNADFTRTSEKAAQRIMEAGIEGTEGYAEVQRLKEDLAAGRIDKKKYDARMGQFSKSPFAQIKGEFVNRSDAENYALAQEAIDSPEWTQVGFDPRRRSVFYDRVDGNAVATADEVVQVGPLVLAKNARFRDDDVMFSRSVEKTAGLANAFAIARGQQWKKNRDLKFEIQQRVRAAAKKAGLNIDDQSDETRQYLVNMGVNDAIEALKDNENAIGWYNRTVRKALETIALIHPEIKTDPLARFRFTFALAVTSNGQKVDKNFELAEEVYQRYKRDGVMPTDVEAGETAGAMNKSFKLFNELSDRWGQKTLSEFMDSTFTVEQLNKMGFKLSGELADTRVLGSVIIGPKIGNGFYSNLNGLFNQLTIDRWFMATWGRWTGSLIDERPDMVNAKASEVRAAVKKLTPNQRQAISAIGIDLDADPETIGLQIKKASSKKENRNVLNKTKAGEQLRLAGNSLAGYLDGQRLTPSGGAERAWIRDVFSGILARLHSQGYNINMSDLQALLWYPEKRLYDASKSKDEASAAGYADEDAPDYANAAAKLAVSMGISPRLIASAQMEVDGERSKPIDGRRGDQQELGGGRAGQDSIQGAGRGLDGRKRRKLLKREILVRSRLGRSSSGKPSKSYKKPSRGTYRGVRGLTHAPSTNFQKLIAAAELRAPTLVELPQTLESAGMFSEAITNSKNASDFGAAVYVYPTAEYRDMKMFITEDGNSGFAIKDDGDIVSVFSNGGGAVHAMLELAVEQGGTKLDAFDTVLPSLYKVSGFKEVGRDSWNEQYKPDDWDKSTFSEFNQGEPDIVYMEYDAAYDPFDTKDKKTFDDDIMMSRVNPRDIEAVVTENKLSAQKATGVPYYSDRAEPRAQYIARNPDEALTPSDDVMFSLQPAKLSSKGQAAVDAIITERTPETMFQSYNEATDQGPISFWLTRLKQWGINRYARLEQLNQDPRLKGLLADSSSIAAALMADRSMGLVGSALKYGVPVYTNGHARVENFVHNGVEYKGLVQINGLLQSTQHGNLSDLAQAYSMAVRGKRLTAEGKAVPITKQQAADIMAEVDSFTDANGANPIKQWYDTYQAYNNKVIEFMEASGVLDPDKAQQWREQSDYIPFYRTDNSGNMTGPARGMFGGLTNAVSFVPYRGSEKSVNVDLIEATSKNLSMAIQMGMQNIAQQRIARDLNTIGLGKRIGFNEEPQGQAITFRVNGKPVRFDVFDPLVYESMQAVGSETSVALAQRFLGFPAKVLRESVTRTPSFMIANMMRDTFSTYVTSGANFIPVIDTVKNLNTDLEALEKLGVVGGYDFSNDPESIGKFYAKENARRGIGKSGGVSVIDGFIRVWDALGTATTKSDAATRKAVYDDVLARTGNHAEAAFQALEVINFSRRGMHPLARVLTAGIPFLNARMQGLDVFARSLAGTYGTDKTKSRADSTISFAFRGGMLVGLTALYYAMVSDDDQYKEQSEEVRDNNFIIPTSMGVPVKLPIPFEVGLMFKTLPETFMAMYDDQKTGKEAYETIKRGIVSTLEINPISGIQAIGPLVEAGINKNFFTGGAIVPYYMTKLEAGAQSYESTAEYAKGIGEMFNISPLKIQHVMEGYGGTSGIFVLDLIDRFLVAPAARDTDMPALKPHEYPIVKRFFAAEHGTGLKQDAYELYGEISKTIQTINKLKQEGRGEELQTYMQSRSTLLSLKKPVYNVKKLLDRSRKQEAMIMRLDIDAELKRKMIDDLKAEVNEALKVVPILKQKADVPVFRSTYG